MASGYVNELKQSVENKIAKVLLQVQIDPSKLPDECATQARLFLDVALSYANMQGYAKTAKLALEQARAEADDAIRAQSDVLGTKKPTETAIANMVIRDPKVQALQEDYTVLEHLGTQLGLVVEAFRQRQYMLTDEVRLRLTDYYTSSTMPFTAETQQIVDDITGMRK